MTYTHTYTHSQGNVLYDERELGGFTKLLPESDSRYVCMIPIYTPPHQHTYTNTYIYTNTHTYPNRIIYLGHSHITSRSLLTASRSHTPPYRPNGVPSRGKLEIP